MFNSDLIEIYWNSKGLPYFSAKWSVRPCICYMCLWNRARDEHVMNQISDWLRSWTRREKKPCNMCAYSFAKQQFTMCAFNFVSGAGHYPTHFLDGLKDKLGFEVWCQRKLYITPTKICISLGVIWFQGSPHSRSTPLFTAGSWRSPLRQETSDHPIRCPSCAGSDQGIWQETRGTCSFRGTSTWELCKWQAFSYNSFLAMKT